MESQLESSSPLPSGNTGGIKDSILEPLTNSNFSPPPIPLKLFKLLTKKIFAVQSQNKQQNIDFSDVIIPTPIIQIKEAIDKSDVAWNDLGTARGGSSGSSYDPSELGKRVQAIKDSIPDYITLTDGLKPPELLDKNSKVEMESLFINTSHVSTKSLNCGYRATRMLSNKKRKGPNGLPIRTLQTLSDDSTIDNDELMIKVNFYCPKKLSQRKNLHINSEFPEIASQYLFYGSQTLASLRDAIYCWEDTFDKLRSKRANSRKRGRSKKSTGGEGTQAIVGKDVSFFIEGVFYNSAALEANANDDTECGSSNGNRISKAIIDYLMEVPGRVKHIGVNDVVTCSPKTIEEVKLEDITIRLNVPYVFIHRNGCEHVFTFSDVRSHQPDFDEKATTKYPIKLFEKLRERKFCQVCDDKYAEYECHDDMYAGVLPFLYCHDCFDEVQRLRSGKKYRYNAQTFMAHPYVHEVE